MGFGGGKAAAENQIDIQHNFFIFEHLIHIEEW